MGGWEWLRYTVCVGPGSELGSISAGRNCRRSGRWSWKSVGLIGVRGVKVGSNFEKWEQGKEGRVSSIE